MLTRPFLTDLDSRAEVKGSVDPLGAMAIWTRMGRRVVGNLSTVTTSVKDFKTLVLGFGLLREMRRAARPEDEVNELTAFLRWEQLAAYARYKNEDHAFRGLRRVKARLGAGQVVVPLSAESDCQILGNQKVYGLWGLFTVPARASGLLEKAVNELTPAAEDFLEHTWKPALSPLWSKLVAWVGRDDRKFNLERHAADIQKLRAVWRKATPAERPFWKRHLVEGGPTDATEGRQSRLALLLKDTLGDKGFELTQTSVKALAKRAAKSDERLAEDLLDIAACESVLAPAAALFAYVQTLDGQSAGKPVNALRQWPKRLPIDRGRFERLVPDLAKATGSAEVAALWQEMSVDFAEGRWPQIVPRLLMVNKLVMEARGGAAWVADEGGTLRVRYGDKEASLPAAGEVGDLWRFPYFLASLRSVLAELEAA
jgi:hypothetical protein